MKKTQRLTSTSATIIVRAWGTCKMVRTKPKRDAPIIMAKIMADVPTVSMRMPGRSFTERVR